jgi:hypothetical protein
MLRTAIQSVAATPRCESLDTLAASVDPAWIARALEASGTATVRRRRLPAEQVVWLVIGMALFRDRPIFDVVDSLDLALPGVGPVARSAPIAARKRLGPDPMAHLFRESGKAWAHAGADRCRWRELSVFGVDGTTFRVPDSPENRTHFGAPHYQGGEGSYPQMRVVTVMAVRTHVIADAAIGPYSDGEPTLAKGLWASIPDNSVTLLDRGFLGTPTLWSLQQSGKERHWVVPAKENTTWREVKRLGRGDLLVERRTSAEARKAHPGLPEVMSMRAVRVKVKGHRERWILTSLLDPVKYPAAEVTALYHERWELELGYDEVKTELLDREETIRSRSPKMVEQEMWGMLIAFNLVRVQMERVAKDAGVAPTRISFSMALRLVTDEWRWDVWRSPGAVPRRIATLQARIGRYLLPPRRTRRSYPRAVKIPMSGYKSRRSVDKGQNAK